LNMSRIHAQAGCMQTGVMTANLSIGELIELLGDPHRSFHAYQRLIGLGPQASEAARQGMLHPDARVRENCCRILDRTMDNTSIPVLTAALSDPTARVRIAAAHALACDRCKKDSCRPTAQDVLAPAIRLLTDDPDARVRAFAAELVGRWVHSHQAACDAIKNAVACDPSPSVRKKASWYAPGGTIYRRTGLKH
jgi:HEAT repeat protein